MRNITVSVPDDVYTAARVFAARRNTSVSAVVTDFLFTVRALSRSARNMSAAEAVDVHRELIRHSPGARRVNIESMSARELFGIFRDFVRAVK